MARPTSAPAASASVWVVYGYETCPWCASARRALTAVGARHTWHAVTPGSAQAVAVKARFGRSTVPIVLRDGVLVGGCDDLQVTLRREARTARSATAGVGIVGTGRTVGTVGTRGKAARTGG
jgi:glutaredoxin